jgi:hypothetical protein
MSNAIARPSLFWLMSEPGRALLELGVSIPFKKVFFNKSKGDGHPVMILPGFLSSETSTKSLRDFVSSQGYQVFDWGLGRNMGKVEYMEALLERMINIYKECGRQITLIGWSLGGVFARQLAKEKPNLVRQVITLASPFGGINEPNNITWLYSLLNGGKKVDEVNTAMLEDLPLPPTVPTTSIYSKVDGIIPWRLCMEKEEDDTHQNIEVHSSHIGMGVNPTAWAIIADRLKQKKVNWKRFQPQGLYKLVFPKV